MSAAREAAAVTGIYDIVGRVVGLDRGEPISDAQAHVIMAELEALDRSLWLPWAPDTLPETPEAALEAARAMHAECAIVASRDDLDALQRSLLDALRMGLAAVIAGEKTTAAGRFAAIGQRDARARGWAAFLGRCAELQRRKSR